MPVRNLSNIYVYILSCGLLLMIYFLSAVRLELGLAANLLLLPLLYTVSPRLFFVYFCGHVFFQNGFIGLFAPIYKADEFKVLHGMHFLTLGATALTVLLDRKNIRGLRLPVTGLVELILVILIIIMYGIIGFWEYGFQNSFVYIRLFLVPLLMYIIGMGLARTIEIRFMKAVFKLMIVFLSFTIFIQFLVPDMSNFAFNDYLYYSMKTGRSFTDLEEFRKPFFNLRFMPMFTRAGGFIKSIVSPAYFITIGALFIFYPKRLWMLALMLLIPTIFINSKGALMLTFFFAAFVLLRRLGFRSFELVVMFLLCWAGIVWAGIVMKNEHILGFIQGAEHLTSLGNGLGFSGNLSGTQLRYIDGPALIDQGYYTRFQNGSESTFGVMFSSMGFFAVFVIGFYIMLMYNSYRKISRLLPQYAYMSTIAFIVFVQGISQEEVFSQYSFGFCTMLLGYLAFHNEMRTRSVADGQSD